MIWAYLEKLTLIEALITFVQETCVSKVPNSYRVWDTLNQERWVDNLVEWLSSSSYLAIEFKEINDKE